MDEINFYDLIIDIESFDDLKSEEKKGWEIRCKEDGWKKYEYFTDNIDEEKSKKLLNRIGILGVSQVGKTFILKKLINKKGKNDEKINTKGISVIYPEIKSDNLFVCIDSQGSEEPIIDRNKSTTEVYNLKEEERIKLVKYLSKDKKLTEIFIQDFIIDNSNIIIVVVDQLTFSEQKLINRLKDKNFDKLFVIHNTQFFENKEIIENHIENTIKKSIFSNLEIKTITNMNQNTNSNEEKPYIYIEKGFGNVNKDKVDQTVIHLFMAKEGSKAGDFFNNQTIDYLRNEIMSQTKTKIFDVLKEIKKFLSFNSLVYMIKEDNKERPIEENEIEIEKGEEHTYIKCKNKNFELKDCIINEMGLSNFTSENSINPSFVCYRDKYVNKKTNEDWPALIIKTEMFADSNDINIGQSISEDNENMNITINCKKTLEEDSNIKNNYDIEPIGGDIKEGIMRISIKFNLQNLTLDDKESPRIREPFPGIKLIYLKIKDDEQNNKNIRIIQTKNKPTKSDKP